MWTVGVCAPLRGKLFPRVSQKSMRKVLQETQDEPEDSDAVLLAFSYAREAAPSDTALLREWTARYPAVADELITVDYARFAAGLTLTDTLEDGPENPALVEFGASVLAARRAARATRPPLTSLLEDAEAQGLNGPQLAQTLRLDRLLLARLEQRALDAATVPLTLVRQIGTVLERSVGEVTVFLRGEARLPASAHYRSRKAPSVVSSPAPAYGAPAPAISFQQAVADSRSLSTEDKAYWQVEADTVLGDESL